MFNIFSSKPSLDLPNLKGKVILVTGANTGIGYETVKQLARRGARVYLGARNEERARDALAKIEKENLEEAGGEVLWMKVDFSDLRSAKAAAEDFLKREERLDVLINNAAQLTGPFEMTPDGICILMTVNHFGPFVFTRTLLPLLIKTSEEPDSDVRIVTVSSVAHYLSYAASASVKFSELSDLNNSFQNDLIPEWSRYSLTKLANVLFSNELQRRLDAEGQKIICLAIHPGAVNTFASRTPFPRIASVLFRIFLTPPEIGAYNSCFCAASSVIKGQPEKWKGTWVEPIGMLKEPGKNAKNEKLAKDLWETTERTLRDLNV